MKIKGKVFKTGTGYGIRIRKALIDAEIFAEGQEVELEVSVEQLNKQLLNMKENNSGEWICFPDQYITMPIVAKIE